MECKRCGGDDAACVDCGGEGKIRIACCVVKLITQDVWDLLADTDWVEKGAWPIGSGTLDNTQCFVDGVKLVIAERAFWRAKIAAKK